MKTGMEKIADQQEWKIPLNWLVECPGLDLVSRPMFCNNEERIRWLLKNNDDKFPFRVSNAWNSIRDKNAKFP